MANEPEIKTCAVCRKREAQEVTDGKVRDKPRGWVTIHADTLPNITITVCRKDFVRMFRPYLEKTA